MTAAKPVADVIEDLEFLNDTHVGATEAAQRTGFASAHAMEKWLERHGRTDLWLAFKHRDPAGTHPSGADRKKKQMNTPTVHPLTALLDEADESTVARHRKKADRIRALIAELRADLEADRERRQQEAQALAALEDAKAALEAAKEALRQAKGQPTATPRTRQQPKGEFPCRLDGCEKVYDTPQGRSLHERMKCDQRAVTAVAS